MNLAALRLLRFAFAASLVFFTSVTAAHATPSLVENFSILNTDGAVAGSVTVDFSTLAATGSMTYFDGTTSFLFSGSEMTLFTSNGSSGAGYYMMVFRHLANSTGLRLAFNYDPYNTDGMTYGYFTLCSIANPCTDGDQNTNVISEFHAPDHSDIGIPTGDVYVTILSAPTVPEPSSFVLLGTGVLGTFGAVRRRFRRS